MELLCRYWKVAALPGWRLSEPLPDMTGKGYATPTTEK
jgi:hypothetical protein